MLAAAVLSACPDLHLDTLGSFRITRDAATCPGPPLGFLLSVDGQSTNTELFLAPGDSSNRFPANAGQHAFSAEVRSSDLKVKPVTATVIAKETITVLFTCG